MVGEMSVRGNVLVGKCPVGKASFGEVSSRGNVRWGSVCWGSVGRGFVFGEVSVEEVSSPETALQSILVTSRNGARKIMLIIRIASRPPTIKRKWNQLSQF